MSDIENHHKEDALHDAAAARNQEAHMSIEEGRKARDIGVAAVDAAGVAGHKTWKPKAEAALDQLIREGRPFTADDLRALVDERPDHPNQIGALFIGASKRGEIRKIGYHQSTIKSRQAGLQAMWIAAEEVAA